MLLADLNSAVKHFENQREYQSPFRGRRGKMHRNC
jgi:hypothetical protein